MAKDKSVRCFDRSRVAPYPCSSSSRDAKQCHSQHKNLSGGGLGLGEAGAAVDVKLWEDARCSICMESPHNTVLLRCSSFDNGCRPFMCNTSYRHSNCLDKFCNLSSVSSPSTAMLHEIPLSNMTFTEVGSDLRPKLHCPLCRGEIYGWSVVDQARQFMNKKARSCSSETCDFKGTYNELRKHARSNHPNVRPTEVDPERQREWTKLELERDLEDVLSSIQQDEEDETYEIEASIDIFRYLDYVCTLALEDMADMSTGPGWTGYGRAEAVRGSRGYNSSGPADRVFRSSTSPSPVASYQGRHRNSPGMLRLTHRGQRSRPPHEQGSRWRTQRLFTNNNRR